MQVELATGSRVAPPIRGVWPELQVDHSVRMNGDVKMRTVFVEPGAAAHPPTRSCAVRSASAIARADSLGNRRAVRLRGGLAATII